MARASVTSGAARRSRARPGLKRSRAEDALAEVARVIGAVAAGDLDVEMPLEIGGRRVTGELLRVAQTVNAMVGQLRSLAGEVTRVARTVGVEGKLGGQAQVTGAAGVWRDLVDNVNLLANNLTAQVRNIADITTAVANGDLSKKVTVAASGEVNQLKDTINTMVDQLRAFAAEVTRVAHEVGVEGRLGGQASVPGVAGTWRDLTENVNFMARNLTTQVRGIVRVVTAVANGDLSQKLVGVEAKGEIAALAETINSMIDTLSTFADQVSTVGREVGIEGKLGGQAEVPGATGRWRKLTDNVNQLAQNLTTQVRAIANVATAVTNGDLTRSIDVEAQGEVAALKDNINKMIENLRETTQKNAEQDWLKTNLAKFSSMLQGQKDLQTVCQLIMRELTPLVSAQHGALYLLEQEGAEPVLKLRASYAFRERKGVGSRFRVGEALVGQCALEKESILVTDVPPGYVSIVSGLGEAAPRNIIVLPVLFEGEVKAVIELASFQEFSPIHRLLLEQLMQSIGVVLNVIRANMRTEELLQQSQKLTAELQSQSNELTEQQERLKSTNAELARQAAELEEKARLLEEQNRHVEEKNREVELARARLEEKAEQLVLVSHYKSEFLANMSHELRTPLNALLVLAKLLAENREHTLTERDKEYAATILASGNDLLSLINEILDLSKIEAGKMKVEPSDVRPSEIREFVERTFRPLANEKGLGFDVAITEDVPETLHTDAQRLKQVLKNLLANAFKFTEAGKVELRVHRPAPGVVFREGALGDASGVVAISVRDTGIGIPADKQALIFEAFQQADGGTSRRYGGTGLGLSISREMARLLGGEIHVQSAPGSGSTFTLYLPERLQTAEASAPLTAVAEPAHEEHPSRRGNGAAKRRARSGRPALAGKRVLVVDDDARNVFALTSLLESHGAEVAHAVGGRQAIERLRTDPFVDAVLLDVMMPDMDGFQTIAELRADPSLADVPVVAVTAKALPGDRERCLAAGAADYLPKPVDEDALLSTLQGFARH